MRTIWRSQAMRVASGRVEESRCSALGTPIGLEVVGFTEVGAMVDPGRARVDPGAHRSLGSVPNPDQGRRTGPGEAKNPRAGARGSWLQERERFAVLSGGGGWPPGRRGPGEPVKPARERR